MFSRQPFITVSFLFILLIIANLHFIMPSASNSPFMLPVMPGTTVTVTQGNNQGDHIAANGSEYAFDFIVGQENFVVTAAQSGKVIGYNDSSNIQCGGLNLEIAPKATLLKHCWAYANFVLIADDDGKTAALYMHLLPYSGQAQMPKVTIGEHVNQGDPIGLAGTTGWSTGVHLHFQVESLPSSVSQQSDPSSGWWWTNSLSITFSNSEVLAQDADGIPKTEQSFLVSKLSTLPPTTQPSTPVSSTVLPGGMWTDPSPTDGQTVSDVIHFAAHAYPTNPGDPAIAKVNFTVNSQGSWQIACTASPPATSDVFTCDANLKNLGVPYGQIQVSFDVYDQAGNVNYAPNGEHTLTYAPLPGVTPVPPTPVPQPMLSVSPGSLYANNDCSWSSDSLHGGSWTCTLTLKSNPGTQQAIQWSASANWNLDPNLPVSFTPSSNVLAPGSSTQVTVVVASDNRISCPNPNFTQMLTFSGNTNTVNVPWSCNPPILSVSPTSLRETTDCTQNQDTTWTCNVTVGQQGIGLLYFDVSANSSAIVFDLDYGELGGDSTSAVYTFYIAANTTCPTSAQLTFTGPGNTVADTWNC